MRIAALLILLAPISAFAQSAVATGARGAQTALSAAVAGSIRTSLPGALTMPLLQLQATPVLSPSLSPSAPALPSPTAALAAPTPAPVTPSAAASIQQAMAAAASLNEPNGRPDSNDLFSGRSESARRFDGAAASSNQGNIPLMISIPLQGFDGYGTYRYLPVKRRSQSNLGNEERAKLDIALRYGTRGSRAFRELNSEFERQGGYYLIDDDRNATYMATAALDEHRRPVILLTYDLLHRYTGRSEDIYRGAPWEFIASVIAREQVLHSSWYSAIPISAEKLAASFMNMTRVFVDLTNGTSRDKGWSTDKDYTVPDDTVSYMQWNWFQRLVAASRAAVSGINTNVGHIIESAFFSSILDAASRDKAAVLAFRYSLWEQYDGKYYRPGDAKNGKPLPLDAPRIDKATYDRAAYTVYGADGKGNTQLQNGSLDKNTVFGWIIQWLKDRVEI